MGIHCILAKNFEEAMEEDDDEDNDYF